MESRPGRKIVSVVEVRLYEERLPVCLTTRRVCSDARNLVSVGTCPRGHGLITSILLV